MMASRLFVPSSASAIGTRLSAAAALTRTGSLLARQQCRFMSVINLSDFVATEKFSQLNRRSVLYFTATWCPPCKMIKPMYEELATKYAGKVAFGKVDVDDNSEAASEFKITSVPTFVFFDGEEIVERFSGADRGRLESLIEDLESR